MPGSHRCLWASEPNLAIALIASEPWTLTKVRSPESPASSSIAASPYSTALRPAQPYPERCMPSSPSVAHLLGELAGEVRGLVPARDVGSDALVDEPAHPLAQGKFVGGEQAVDVEVVVGEVGHRNILSSSSGRR